MTAKSPTTICITAKKGETLFSLSMTKPLRLRVGSASTTDYSPSDSAFSQRAPLSKEPRLFNAAIRPGPGRQLQHHPVGWPRGPEVYRKPMVLRTAIRNGIKDVGEQPVSQGRLAQGFEEGGLDHH